ncbi:MAG: 3-methyladenine DNA glycosylase AlkC, partial [Paraglaciecola sp.]
MSLMKESLNSQAVTCIADAFLAIEPEFDHQGFCQTCVKGLAALELKQRVQHIIDVLHQYLPADFTHTAVLFTALADQHAKVDVSYPLSGFTAWPVIDYISVHGLQHPELALDLLKRLTHLFSAEFAIRPFILQYPELTYSQFHLWLTHNSEHVRRLVSEGSRPRLPWGMQLKPLMVNPDLNIVLLNKLKQDPSLYVRRSVANHLNDISKDHPLKLIGLCQNWYSQADDKLLWVIRHATRSLVKAGHPKVFPLLGYTANVRLSPAILTLESAHLALGQ